jgi:hypothetical protein
LKVTIDITAIYNFIPRQWEDEKWVEDNNKKGNKNYRINPINYPKKKNSLFQ